MKPKLRNDEVVCIENFGWEGTLTIGRRYKAYSQNDDENNILIFGDNNFPSIVSSDMFMGIEEYRDLKLNNILNG